MHREFKAFVLRGKVLDLAVAVVIGGAVGAVVLSFTNDVLMALVAAVFGKPSFNQLTLGIGKGVVHYGKFLTVLMNFLIIAAVVFLAVKAAEKLAPGETRGCPRCTTQIPLAATRCPACTSEVEAAA